MVPRYWSERSEQSFARTRAITDGLGFAEAKNMFFALAFESIDANDPESLAGVLRCSDEVASAQEDVATLVRFSSAVKAMNLKRYECAVSAWDDCGRVFDDTPRFDGVPSGTHAAIVLRDVCIAILDLQRAVRLGQSVSANDLSSMLNRIL